MFENDDNLTESPELFYVHSAQSEQVTFDPVIQECESLLARSDIQTRKSYETQKAAE